MCISFGGKKKGPSHEEYVMMDQINRQNHAIMEQRTAMAAQQQQQNQQQQAFQEQQNAYLGKIAEMQQAAADREAASYQALTAAQHAASLPSLVQSAATQAEAEPDPGQDTSAAMDSLRKGRRALRIDLQAGAQPALNVPRG